MKTLFLTTVHGAIEGEYNQRIPKVCPIYRSRKFLGFIDSEKAGKKQLKDKSFIATQTHHMKVRVKTVKPIGLAFDV